MSREFHFPEFRGTKITDSGLNVTCPICGQEHPAAFVNGSGGIYVECTTLVKADYRLKNKYGDKHKQFWMWSRCIPTIFYTFNYRTKKVYMCIATRGAFVEPVERPFIQMDDVLAIPFDYIREGGRRFKEACIAKGHNVNANSKAYTFEFDFSELDKRRGMECNCGTYCSNYMVDFSKINDDSRWVNREDLSQICIFGQNKFEGTKKITFTIEKEPEKGNVNLEMGLRRVNAQKKAYLELGRPLNENDNELVEKYSQNAYIDDFLVFLKTSF